MCLFEKIAARILEVLVMEVTLLILLVSLTGCGNSRHQQSNNQTQSSTLTYVLFDVSDSAKNRRDRYFHDFARIVVEKSQGNETFMGDLITSNSMATSSLPLNITLPANTWNTNPYDFADLKKGIDNQAYGIIYQKQPKKAQRTDLMNAFQLAENMFSGSKATSKKLIVFSDMIEQSGRYNFYSESLTDRRIAEILKAEKVNNRLPNLKGVEVWIDGAGATDNPLPPGKLRALKKFWIEYFQACGADLKKYRYSSSLINYN